MAEQKIKPIVEDTVNKHLNGDKKQLALDFAAWLRTNKMSPGFAGYGNAFNSACKGKTICKIELEKGDWGLMLYLWNIRKYENLIVEEGLQSIIWQMLIYCRGGCEAKCAPGSDLTIFGKDFKNLCNDKYVTLSRFWVRIKNPDEAAILKIKRLLELEQKARKGLLT